MFKVRSERQRLFILVRFTLDSNAKLVVFVLFNWPSIGSDPWGGACPGPRAVARRRGERGGGAGLGSPEVLQERQLCGLLPRGWGVPGGQRGAAAQCLGGPQRVKGHKGLWRGYRSNHLPKQQQHTFRPGKSITSKTCISASRRIAIFIHLLTMLSYTGRAELRDLFYPITALCKAGTLPLLKLKSTIHIMCSGFSVLIFALAQQTMKKQIVAALLH